MKTQKELEENLLELLNQHGGVITFCEAYGDTPRTRNNLYYQITAVDGNVFYATNLSDEFLVSTKMKKIKERQEGIKCLMSCGAQMRKRDDQT